MRAKLTMVVGAFAASAGLLTACRTPTRGTLPTPDIVPTPTPLACSVTATYATTADVDLLAAKTTVSIQNTRHSVTFRSGKPSSGTRKTVVVEVPQSQTLRLHIMVGGQEHGTLPAHTAATVTVDYSNCNVPQDHDPLHVWRLKDSGQFDERVCSVDDPDTQTVTFAVDHLSTYAIVY